MIRPARPDPFDVAYVRSVRNHPNVRAASLDTHEITAEEHAAWWANGGQAQTWIIEEPCDLCCADPPGNCPAGYVRVSPDGNVSIAVTKWARGRGVGERALRALMVEHTFLSAEVRHDNEPSRRLFERCGFREVRRGVVEDVVRYEWSVN
jgi:RimJ/RimL family protein N-acetyltransferase